MTGAPTQPDPSSPVQPRPRVSIVWAWLNLILMCQLSLVPIGGRQPGKTRDADVARNDASKSNMVRLAELYGDYRSERKILQGNELIDAAYAGDVAKVRDALAGGADANARYVEICRYGYTALMEASFAGHENMVALLLAEGANPNLERDGITALHLAVRQGHESIIQRLVAAGTRQDVRRLRFTNRLIRASCKGFVMGEGERFPPRPGVVDNPDVGPSLEEVLREGGDINGADPRGFTPLMYAANLGLLENVQTLLNHGADPKRAAKDGATALEPLTKPLFGMPFAPSHDIFFPHGGSCDGQWMHARWLL